MRTYRVVASGAAGSGSGRRSRPTRRFHYPLKVMGGLGIAQIFLGALAAILQVVALCTLEPTSFIGAGLWGGAAFAVAGGLAVVAAKRPGGKASWPMAVMVGSILAALVALGVLAVASIGLHLTANVRYDTGSFTSVYPLSWKTLESLFVVIALVEALVALLTSVMACKIIHMMSQIPKSVGRKKDAPVFVYMPDTSMASSSIEMPPEVEMRTLVTRNLSSAERSRPISLAVHPHAGPSTGPPGIIVDAEDFEPPPAYSERE